MTTKLRNMEVGESSVIIGLNPLQQAKVEREVTEIIRRSLSTDGHERTIMLTVKVDVTLHVGIGSMEVLPTKLNLFLKGVSK